MPFWKTILRPWYYAATLPVRWWMRRLMEADHRAPVVVLAYHRVAADQATPWTVSDRMFARQIDWLADRFDVISLEEGQRRLRTGDNWRTAVSITFDDGYADNCRHAIPLLVKWRLPCTYFVTVENVLHGRPFAHDLALGQSLLPNNVEELRAMAAAGVEIGAHGYEHTDLGQIEDPAALHRQLATARQCLQTLLGCPVRYFAFPFGQYRHLSVAAMDMARASGYAGVCSAYGGYNFPGEESFHLQRIPVDNSMAQLKNAVTLDPRKIRTPRFAWQPCSAALMQEATP